jgi:SAM-dependent methyltransferase
MIILTFFLAIVILFMAVGMVYGAPWVPSSSTIDRKMLVMAKVQAGDIVYDLGSGDGRVIILAARKFNAKSVGIEINPFWVVWARFSAVISRVSGKVSVVWGNFFDQDLGRADVLTLYLLQDTNARLKPKLERELRPGTRIISHVYTFEDWEPVEVDEDSDLYLYIR